MCALYACGCSCRSTMEVSAVSSQGAPPPVVPVRPPPGEQPAKGFSWEDYEGVQVDEDASEEEEGGWGVVRSRRSQFIFLCDVQSSSERMMPICRTQQDHIRRRRSGGHVAVAVTAAHEETAPECAETGGVEGGQTREGSAAAGGFHGAQARTRARAWRRASCCCRSKAYRISL